MGSGGANPTFQVQFQVLSTLADYNFQQCCPILPDCRTTSILQCRRGFTDNSEIPVESHLRKLSPILNGGILRVEGMVHYAALIPYDARHPVILSNSHRYTELLVRDCHEKRRHRFGTNQLLCLLNRLTGSHTVVK